MRASALSMRVDLKGNGVKEHFYEGQIQGKMNKGGVGRWNVIVKSAGGMVDWCTDS